MNTIAIIDHVLTVEECRDFINLWHSDSTALAAAKTWGSTLPRDLDPQHPQVRIPVQKILAAAQQQEPRLAIDWLQIVQWPQGSSQAWHQDTASSRTVMTSILYLNDDYQGGFTQFKDDVKIPAKQGRMILFDGQARLHGVSQVTQGVRYTVPVWYKATVA